MEMMLNSNINSNAAPAIIPLVLTRSVISSLNIVLLLYPILLHTKLLQHNSNAGTLSALRQQERRVRFAQERCETGFSVLLQIYTPTLPKRFLQIWRKVNPTLVPEGVSYSYSVSVWVILVLPRRVAHATIRLNA